jgi:hypothetical protein
LLDLEPDVEADSIEAERARQELTQMIETDGIAL